MPIAHLHQVLRFSTQLNKEFPPRVDISKTLARHFRNKSRSSSDKSIRIQSVLTVSNIFWSLLYQELSLKHTRTMSLTSQVGVPEKWQHRK